jgi:hypothetical protein
MWRLLRLYDASLPIWASAPRLPSSLEESLEYIRSSDYSPGSALPFTLLPMTIHKQFALHTRS